MLNNFAMPSIRRLTSDDADVASAVRLIARFHHLEVPASHLQRVLSNLTNVLIAATVRPVGGAEGADSIGFLFAHRLDRFSRAAKHYFIDEIEVDAAHRRRGIGRSLIHAMLLIARADRSDCFAFTNHANPGARAFYQSTGGAVRNSDDLLFVYRADRTPHLS